MSSTHWSLVALETPVRGRSIAAKLPDDSLVEIDVLPVGLSLLELCRAWDMHGPRLRDWAPDGASAILAARIVAPLQYPGAVICIGANYHGHREEMDAVAKATPSRPFIFLKPPVTTVIGDNETVLIRSEDDKVDWEAEIALVIGKHGRNIARDDALDHVAGYTLINDVSARGVFQIEAAPHVALEYDWLAAKGQDTFCPMGPGILPAWFIGDLGNIEFKLTVNGEVMQDGTTADMVVDIPDLIVAASRFMSLNPGDVIATGTPAGVGGGRGRFLKHGDEMIVSCPAIGTLRNRVRSLDFAG